MSTKYFQSAISILLLLSAISSCRAQNKSPCLPSSCGSIQDISYPFRLKSDPKDCGMSGFELDCLDNRTVIHLKSKTYFVQTISYDNYTIRLVNPVLEKNNFCILPNSSDDYNDLPGHYYMVLADRNIFVSFITCLAPVISPSYINSTSCSNRNSTFASNSFYSYVSLGHYSTPELDKSCKVDKVVWSSAKGPIATDNTSLSNIYAGLGYGFELSWNRVLCQQCEATKGDCTVLETVVTCRHYCKEDTPYRERSFWCKVEYYGIVGLGVVIIAGILAGRFILGMFFLFGVVVYQWRRSHLSMDGDIEHNIKTHTIK